MTIELVRTEAYAVSGMVLLNGEEAWLTFSAPWWDLAGWFRWWLMSGRKTWLLVRPDDGKPRVRVRAVRLTRKYLRIGAP